jgi:hypothetical protein
VLLKEADRGVGEQFGGEFLADALLGEFAVGAEIADGNFFVVRHTAEHDALALLERAEPRGLAVVPFAGAESGVAVFAEEFGQEFLAGEGGGIHREPRLAGHEHGAAGHADGAAVAAHHVVAPKARAVAHEAVDDGRLDVSVAVGADGVGALIVGEENENVGLGGRGSGCRGEGEQEGQRDGEKERRGEGDFHREVEQFGFGVG